jgi:hypothetical protein
MTEGNDANDEPEGATFSLRLDLSVPGTEAQTTAGLKGDAGVARQLRELLARHAVVALRFGTRVLLLPLLALAAAWFIAADIVKQGWSLAGEIADELMTRDR